MKKLVIFDLDGVIYVGDEVLPHVPETLKILREQGLLVRFLTNNSAESRQNFQKKLNGMSIEAHHGEIMTSSYATRAYLDEKTGGRARVFIVGEQGINDELEGYTIVGPRDRRRADFVVAGYDRRFSYRKLAWALDAMTAGAELIATNLDATYPMPGGRVKPGGGSIVAAVATAGQCEPVCCGKPDPFGIRFLMREAGAAPGETLLVGDRADSDMMAASRAGVDSCLVLTGITRPEELDSLDGELKPAFVINDLGELVPLLERIAGRNTV